MDIGYARVSTTGQSLDSQMDALVSAGCDSDHIYTDKASGAKSSRPGFDEMMKYVREGDRVVVFKLDRIARSTRHLLEVSEELEGRGVELYSISEGIDTATPMGRFYFTVIAAIAELERDLIRERTQAGLAAARARGRSGGRPSIDAKTVKRIRNMYDSREFTVTEIAEACRVSPASVYNYVRSKND